MSIALLLLLLPATATAESFYPANEFQDVKELSKGSYDALVTKGVDPEGGRVFHVVKFYDSEAGNRKAARMRPHMIAAAKKLRSSSAMVSAVDFGNDDAKDVFASVDDISEKDLPLVKIFSPDGESETYKGKEKDLGDYVAKKVQKYVADNLATMMPLLAPKQKAYKAYKKDKSLPRVVLLLEPKGKSKKRQIAYDAAAALALYFSGRVNFAYSKHKKIVRNFGAGELPALFLIPKGQKFNDNRAYTGTLAYRPLRTWLSQFAEPSESIPAALPAPSAVDFIPEMTSQGCLDKYCVSRGGVCVFSLLPAQSLPAGETEYYLESIRLVRRALVEKLGHVAFNAIHFSWMDSYKYSEWLEAAFGLHGAEYVRTMVYYPKKQQWGQYVGSFSPPELSKWVIAASKGKATVEPAAFDTDLPTFKANDQEAGDESGCGDLREPLPDEVVPSNFARKGKSTSKGSGSRSKPGGPPPQPPPMISKRLPRPRSKAGKNYELTSDQFEDNVLNTPSNWLVWFKTADASEEEAKAWNQAARLVKGQVQFASMSPEESAKVFEEHGIEAGESRVRLFPAAPQWESPESSKLSSSQWVDVEMTEPKPIVEKALSFLSNPPTMSLVWLLDSKNPQQNFEAWFQKGGNMMKPRFVLFPSKDLSEPPYLLRALAIEFGMLEFGLAKNSDKDFASNFGVQKTPSAIIIGPQGPPKQDGQLQLGVSPYNGHISFNAIAIFIERQLRVVPQQPPPQGGNQAPPHDEL